MDNDRRKDERYRYPLEAHWHAASSQSRSRVTDISKGGCFVESLTPPAVGERIELTFCFQDLEVVLPGCTRQVEPGIGFSIEFEALSGSTTEALEQLLHMVRARLQP
jgi:hypothetical protein